MSTWEFSGRRFEEPVMRVKKTERFADLGIFSCVHQPDIAELKKGRFPLKGCWAERCFRNRNPITLELGCGQADYTVLLAERFPERNFIGLERRGARLWLGAKQVLEKELVNASFIRGPGDFLTSLFAPQELDEIILSFPDPYPDRPRKTFVSELYLKRFAGVLHESGRIHLKTDNDRIYQTAREEIQRADGIILQDYPELPEIDLDQSEFPGVMGVRSRYERKFRAQGKPIRYLAFRFSVPDPSRLPNSQRDDEAAASRLLRSKA
jgi:tRNA (guanine-N7-)-methyltransferase